MTIMKLNPSEILSTLDLGLTDMLTRLHLENEIEEEDEEDERGKDSHAGL